jgi:asparagine synthase (glutamine-hydrolysing)
MCGIAGFAGAPDRQTLDRMVESLRHRGPDDSGVWESHECSLGMRRLSIIDVASGHQPVFNETGDVVTVFNGEIYNHVELRKDLAARGHRFRTDHSDTEVIVHLYEEYGLAFPEQLNGMFAIALWDAARRRLLLVRDRVGIKPLYVARLAGGLAFASEPKALLVHPAVSRAPNFAALHHYFSFKNVPAPMTAFADIEQLRAGEMLVFEHGAPTRHRWWRVRLDDGAGMDETEAASRLRALLEDAVRLNMRSDVPVGAYLSGGLDSSSVVALMSRLTGRPVVTFTLTYADGFASKDADRDHARDVSRLFDTDHHEQIVRPDDIPAAIDDIVDAFDEPFSGVVSTFFLTRLIARHVKVALSGDGADELFGSYLPHRLAEPLALARRHAGGRTDLGPEESAALGGWRDTPDELRRLIARGDEAATRMAQYLRDEDAKRALYSDKMLSLANDASSERLVRSILSEANTADALNRALFLDLESLLPDQVLAFVDRLSMAHSVEVRPPFLDHRVVEFATRLQGRMKIKAGRVKHILKEAVRDLLPVSVLDRPKEGFIMPVNEWLRGALAGFAESVLAPARISRHGLWRPEAVRHALLMRSGGGSRDRDGVWNLVMFQLWWERYVGV